jgi:hypothetical protein
MLTHLSNTISVILVGKLMRPGLTENSHLVKIIVLMLYRFDKLNKYLGVCDRKAL